MTFDFEGWLNRLVSDPQRTKIIKRDGNTIIIGGSDPEDVSRDGYDSHGNFVGIPFTIRDDKKVQNNYGYLKATGKWDMRDNEEHVELFCIRSGKKRFVPYRLLEPFPWFNGQDFRDYD